MSLLRKLTVLALLAGVFAWLRKVLSEDIVARNVPAEPGPAEAEPAQPAPNGAEPTKAELYQRAQELEIEGRSKMSKAELARAISRAD